MRDHRTYRSLSSEDSIQPATFTPDGGKVEQRLLDLFEMHKALQGDPCAQAPGKAQNPFA